MMHFIIRVTLINIIDGKSHKLELKGSMTVEPIMQSQNHATSYLWPRGSTHIYIKVILKNQVCARRPCFLQKL